MVQLGSPFYALWETIAKSLSGKSDLFHVELDERAQKQLKKLGPEERKRALRVIGKVHGTPVSDPNQHVTRLNESQHKNVGLDPASRSGYTLGDYRIRMMGQLTGNKMRVFDVGTREDSKHTGRTAR